MREEELILLLVLILGYIGKNHLVVAASGVVLLVSLFGFRLPFAFLEHHGLAIGIVFLIMALLVPFATGKIGFMQIKVSLLSLPGILAVIVGAVASYLGAEGVNLLKIKPEIIIGLVLGSIIGAVVFKGIPVGPLVAAGMTAVLFELLS